MARILIIEDEIDMAMGLKDNFEFEGHEVTIANDGETGLKLARDGSLHLIILDIMLPQKSGFDVCKELRNEGISTPIIMVSARGQEIDKVLGLEIGADDYITKPFGVRELLARVNAVLRRMPYKENQALLVETIGKLTVDFQQLLAASDDGSSIDLSHKEFELLQYLLLHKGEIISRDALLDEVWGYEHFPTSRTVDNFIVKLRKKIEIDPSKPRHIITVHGTGYKLV
ncbi:response regulator transcription factor [candidate division KSB1 bacterium]|nr:response regulator transcription factor [candidate division KSB1 bacterium]